eukprot:3794042-Rhodomonas_salina.1
MLAVVGWRDPGGSDARECVSSGPNRSAKPDASGRCRLSFACSIDFMQMLLIGSGQTGAEETEETEEEKGMCVENAVGSLRH